MWFCAVHCFVGRFVLFIIVIILATYGVSWMVDSAWRLKNVHVLATEAEQLNKLHFGIKIKVSSMK